MIALPTHRGVSKYRPAHLRALVPIFSYNLAKPVQPGHGRAVLLVTDTIGEAWHDGRMDALLRSWGAVAPTAVLTVLPQRMWAGSGVRAVPGKLRRSTIERSNLTAQEPMTGSAPIPIMELSARWLAPWAALLSGSAGWRNVALLLPPGASRHIGPNPLSYDSAAKAVRQFRASASPTAFQLACYLSATALNPPVMRLIQRVMLPKSEVIHLAEVFLSGLIYTVAPTEDQNTGDIWHYDFKPYIRDELNNYLMRDEVLDVVHETSRYISERFGRSNDFAALLSDPAGAPLPILENSQGHHLAYINATVLAKLGGRYKVLADRLANAVPAESASTALHNFARDQNSPIGISRSELGKPRLAQAASSRFPTMARSSPAESSIRPYFFLSYARTPLRDGADTSDPDRWVYKLFRDLRDEILQMTDARPDEAGYMDRENKLGAEWTPELMAALKTCRVFVPLYSRRYFESDNCGKEWFAFAQREVMHQAHGEDMTSAIVPALWARLDRERIPDVAKSFQYDHADLGERYRAEGFYGIMKLRNYRGDYQRAVHRLAERVIEIGDQSVAHSDDDLQGMEPRDFESLPSAFGPSSARRTVTDQFQIAVLAPDISTIPPGRTNDYYGETPHSWSPYRPMYSQPLADYALELARKCLDSEPMIFVIDKNERPQYNRPTLVLVDPWGDIYTRIRGTDSCPQQYLRALGERVGSVE